MRTLRIARGPGVRPRRNTVRGTLLIGVGPRLVAAILTVMLLWAMFFWATSALGDQ